MSRVRRAEVLAARAAFFGPCGIAVAVLAVVHILPKDPSPRNGLRLICTLAYFAALLVICWQMTTPRSRYLKKLFAWRFEDCSAALDRTWRQYLFSVDALARPISLIFAIWLMSTFLSVLSYWDRRFLVLQPVYGPLWWLSSFAFFLFPFACGFLISEVFQRRVALKEMLETSTHDHPRSISELNLEESKPAEAVEVLGQERFRVAGTDWHWEDLSKNCVIFGQTGSGKTACVLNPLLDALIGSGSIGQEPVAGLVLDPKGDFRGKLEVLCRRHGRSEDLLVLDPRHPRQSFRWNPLDSKDDELELASRLVDTMETIGMKPGENSFWADAARKFLRHAIALQRHASQGKRPPSLSELGRLTNSPGAIADLAASVDPNDPATDPCLRFFAEEWNDLAPETRSGIAAQVTNLVDPFTVPPFDRLFQGRSTMRLGKSIDRGKILYVDMPRADREQMSRIVGTMLKLEYFREVRRRVDKARPTFFLCDEFQQYLTAGKGRGDADFFEVSRQSHHVNIIATQNLPALLKQITERAPIDNLLGNCAIKIFLRNTDRETNKYASELFGQDLVTMHGTGAGSGQLGLGRIGLQGMGRALHGQAQYDDRIRPERFTELAIPTRDQAYNHCEAIVHLASAPIADHRLRKLRWPLYPIVA